MLAFALLKHVQKTSRKNEEGKKEDAAKIDRGLELLIQLG